MDISARLTSKGQITIPKPVRDALALKEGNRVLFRVVEGEKATLARTPNLLDLAGTVAVPPTLRGVPREDIRRRAWAAQVGIDGLRRLECSHPPPDRRTARAGGTCLCRAPKR